jgi:hypothetical protein
MKWRRAAVGDRDRKKKIVCCADLAKGHRVAKLIRMRAVIMAKLD